jgi:Zn-dependent protease with chaperone function
VKAAIHHTAEYRADKFAAEMMGTAVPMISAFKKMGAAMDDLFKEHYAQMSHTAKIVKNLVGSITHPSPEKRTTRLSGMSF